MISSLRPLITHKFFPIFILFIISLLFFYPIIFGGNVFFFGDTLLNRVPSMVYWKHQLSLGQLPLWNPYVFAGLPHLADLSSNTLSPFNIIYLLVDNPFIALSLLTVLEIFLSSILVYYYLINFTSVTPALFGAIVWAYSGTTLAATNDINTLQGIILIPAVILAAHHLCTRPRIVTIINLSLVLLLQFISGHPQYSYYTWIFTCFYLFVFLQLSIKYKLRIIFTVFIFFLGLSSVQLLPFIELSGLTYRPQDLQFSNQNSLSPIDLPSFVVADVYGSWRTGSSWGPNSPLETGRANTEGYVGVIPLGLTLIALVKVKSRHAHFFLATAIVSLILAFGSLTPLFTLARQFLPLFNKFRSPIRITAFYTLGLSYVSALGLNHLISKHDHS